MLSSLSTALSLRASADEWLYAASEQRQQRSQPSMVHLKTPSRPTRESSEAALLARAQGSSARPVTLAATTDATSLFAYFNSVAADAAGLFVAAGADGGLFVSSDGGQTYAARWTGNEYSFYVNSVAVAAQAASHMLAGTTEGLLASDDHGASFRSVLGYGYWKGVAVSDDGRYAYAVPSYQSNVSKVFVSSDYLQSFTELPSSFSDEYYSDVATSADGKIVYVASQSNFYISKDFGATWTRQPSTAGIRLDAKVACSADGKQVALLADKLQMSYNFGATFTNPACCGLLGAYRLTDVAMSPDGQTVLVAVDTDTLYISNDYGVNYTATVASGQYWTTVAVANNGLTLFGAASKGYIYQSKNNGTSWSPLFYMYTGAASSKDGSVRFAVTGMTLQSNIFKYSAGKWQQLTENVPKIPFHSVACDAACKHVVAVGYFPYIFISSNGGETWTEYPLLSVLASVVDVTISDNGKFMALCVEQGTIYTSNDYGVTWKASNAPSQYWSSITSSASGQFLTAMAYMSDMLEGTIYYSSNYGATWTEASGAPGLAWYSASCDSTGEYVVAAAGLGSSLHYSQNYGVTWTESSNTTQPNWAATAVSASGAIMYAATGGADFSQGSIFMSSNYGQTWTALPAPMLPWITLACDSTGQFLTAAVFEGEVHASSDFGVSWTAQSVAIISAEAKNNEWDDIDWDWDDDSIALTAGAIAGIVVGSCAGCFCLGGIVFFLCFAGNKKPMSEQDEKKKTGEVEIEIEKI